MEREQSPIVIVLECRINLVFHVVGLAAKLVAQVGYVHRLAVFILARESNLAGLGLPLPCVGDVHSGKLRAPRISDRFNLPERIETVGLSDLFYNRRTRLCPGSSSKD